MGGPRPKELIGRHEALRALRAAVGSLQEGPSVVLISGEAGIGKTCLVDHLQLELSDNNLRVLKGGCIELAGDPIPYAPIAEVLRNFYRAEARTAQLGAEAQSDLARLMGIERSEQSAGRGELYERVLWLLEALADEARRVMLVLEDLHWADQATLDLVAFLVRNLPARLMLILTYRNDEIGLRRSLQTLLVLVARETHVRWIELNRLNRDDIARLAELTLGGPVSEKDVERLVTRSGGNPLLAEELMKAKALGGSTATLDDVLLARVNRLNDNAVSVLGLVAIIGRTVSHDELVAVAGSTLDVESTLLALKELLDCGLLTVDTQNEEYTFRHELTQEAMLRRLLPGDRRRLHATVAAALQGRPENSRSAGRAAECATHWYLAGDRRTALGSAVAAGCLAADVHAYTEALRQFSRAVELFDQVVDASATCPLPRLELMMHTADAARWTGASETALSMAKQAMILAENPVDQGRVSERIGQYSWDAGRNQEAKEAFESAHLLLKDSPPTPLTAAVAASRAHFLLLAGTHKAAIPSARNAIETAIAGGSRAAEGRAKITLGLSLVFDGSLEDGVALVRAGHELINQHGDLDDRRRADSNLSYALLMAGDTSAACDVAISGIALIRRYGLDAAAGSALTANAVVLLRLTGRWSEAERLTQQIEAAGLPPAQAPYLHLGRAELDIARGDLRQARKHLDLAWESANGQTAALLTTDLQLAECELALEKHELKAAREQVRQALADMPSGAPARWVLLVCRLALRVAAHTAEEDRWIGASPSAETINERDSLLRQAQQARSASPSPEVDALAATAEAEYSRCQLSTDPNAWRKAAEAWDRMSRPKETAYSCLKWAEAEMDTKRSPTSAAAPLRKSHALATALGATIIRRQGEELARRSRINIQSAQKIEQRRTTPADQLGLTAREKDVLQALVLGHTNREIGRQLFLSHRTVAVHVSNLLSKLGVSNRGQAAAAATRLRLFHDEEGH